jgi:hypothetical protein
MNALLLSLAMLGQCSGGSCPAPSRATYAQSFAGSYWPQAPAVSQLPQASYFGWHWARSNGRNVVVWGHQYPDGSVWVQEDHPLNRGRL